MVPTPPKGTTLTAIPRIGLGTARVKNATEVVAAAIENGYRHIDAAFAYGNQKEVGLGIKEGLKRTGLARSDLWITSKLGGDRHGKEDFAIKETLQELGLDYLDLFLVHWPMGNTTGKYVYDYATVWKEMEKLVRPVNGTRFIGISNHSPAQVEEVLKEATIKPYLHQFELHPYLQQSDWVQTNFKHNLTVTGYAPLANTNPVHNLAVSDKASGRAPIVINTPTIQKIVQARGCTPAQVVLAWNLARGVVVIPKAARVEHQKENIATLEQCKLTEQDIKDVNALNVPLRLYRNACGYGLTEGCDQK
ncbi:hypothetical protein BT63DRAFT_370469 [Microthyrium microscopicum]|uniref:NADP-dependent oxidoreductase domain-containing protein n=1 Tax=Microthyrium microscopicum TaxID=703497 RepID=A0A6A6UHJ8_9PEZI|nr:hypothetical protein BT63DRAFT_370469 [Microthyrium microscopicum]